MKKKKLVSMQDGVSRCEPALWISIKPAAETRVIYAGQMKSDPYKTSVNCSNSSRNCTYGAQQLTWIFPLRF